MERVLEAIFRHFFLLILLIILLPIVGAGVTYFLPRSYQATASLWALQRYAVIGATGPETNLNATPADTQATALSELLQSHSFALTVANDTNLASTLAPSVRGDPQQRDAALYTEISKNVQAQSQGYNLFEISYTNRNPVIAQQVVQAVITNFGIESQGFSTVEGHQLLQGYETELNNAKQAANDAVVAEQKYLAAHPGLTTAELANDPQYAFLQAQAQQAQATVTNIEATIATINQELSTQGFGANSLYKVLDAPRVQGVSRLKTYLMAGGVGLGLALLACVLYILILVRRDRSVYGSLDLRKVTALPILMQVPTLKTPALSMVVESEPGAGKRPEIAY